MVILPVVWGTAVAVVKPILIAPEFTVPGTLSDAKTKSMAVPAVSWPFGELAKEAEPIAGASRLFESAASTLDDILNPDGVAVWMPPRVRPESVTTMAIDAGSAAGIWRTI